MKRKAKKRKDKTKLNQPREKCQTDRKTFKQTRVTL